MASVARTPPLSSGDRAADTPAPFQKCRGEFRFRRRDVGERRSWIDAVAKLTERAFL